MESQLQPPQQADGEVDEFARDIEDTVLLPPHVDALGAAVATVCTLSVRLSGGEVRALLEALPGALRPMFESSARPHEPGEPFDHEEFLKRVAGRLRVSEVDAERIALGVFGVLRTRLPEVEIHDVAEQLPGRLKDLWLRSAPGLGPLLPRVGHFVLGEIERSGVLPLGVGGAHALEAVTCTLSQAVGEDCGGSLPGMFPKSLRPLVERCSSHRAEPSTRFDAAGFVQRVATHLDTDPETAEQVARVVFDAVRRYLVSPEDADGIAGRLAPETRDMWREPLRPSLAEQAEEEPEPV